MKTFWHKLNKKHMEQTKKTQFVGEVIWIPVSCVHELSSVTSDLLYYLTVLKLSVYNHPDGKQSMSWPYGSLTSMMESRLSLGNFKVVRRGGCGCVSLPVRSCCPLSVVRCGLNKLLWNDWDYSMWVCVCVCVCECLSLKHLCPSVLVGSDSSLGTNMLDPTGVNVGLKVTTLR